MSYATVSPTSTRSGVDPHQRSEALKERIYVTFTALAVIITLERDAAHVTVSGAALALMLAVFGTLLAVFVADIVAHMVRESSLPSRAEIGHLVYVSFGSMGVLVVPMAILGLSALEVVELVPALRAIAVTLAATLVVVALLAVHRLQVTLGSKILALAIVTALGLAALATEIAVH